MIFFLTVDSRGVLMTQGTNLSEGTLDWLRVGPKMEMRTVLADYCDQYWFIIRLIET